MISNYYPYTMNDFADYHDKGFCSRLALHLNEGQWLPSAYTEDEIMLIKLISHRDGSK